MLERIRKSGALRATSILLLGLGASALSSCASKPEPQLVSTGEDKRESSLPWNRQERWEGTGQFGGLTQEMEQGGRR